MPGYEEMDLFHITYYALNYRNHGQIFVCRQLKEKVGERLWSDVVAADAGTRYYIGPKLTARLLCPFVCL